MLMKATGGAVLVMAGGKIGYDTASRYKRRVKELQAFESGLWGLSSDINFLMTTIDESMIKISKLVPTKVSDVFRKTGELIKSGNTAAEAWKKALETEKDNLCINDGDIDILNDFGNYIGKADADTEIEKIKNTIEKLKIRERDADNNEHKYGKLCKTAGVSIGAFLAILLM